jgi:hypothetical protein
VSPTACHEAGKLIISSPSNYTGRRGQEAGSLATQLSFLGGTEGSGPHTSQSQSIPPHAYLSLCGGSIAGLGSVGVALPSVVSLSAFLFQMALWPAVCQKAQEARSD